MADDEKVQKGAGQLKVEYYAPDEAPTVFSDGAFVINTGNEFVISFYQTQYPPITDEIKPPDNTVKSRCIVRIVLTPFQMRRLTQAFQLNVEKANAKAENAGN